MRIEISRHQKIFRQLERETQLWEKTVSELKEAHHRKMDEKAKAFEAQRVEDSVHRQKILEKKVEEEQEHRETLLQ